MKLGFEHISDRKMRKLLMEYRNDNDLPWFTRPWDLNLLIVGDETVGEWGDEAIIICNDDSDRPVVHRCVITRDAWDGEFLKPTHPDGCVWVLPGHYPQGYKKGHHRGRRALMQNKPFMNVRWPKSKGYIPKVSELLERGKTHGFLDRRGTNWHNRASGSAPAKPRTDDSEGCPVSLYYHQHAAAMQLVDLQEKYRGSGVVSPTFLQISEIT